MAETKPRPRKAKAAPEPASDPREHLKDWKGARALSGSGSAEFSYVLFNQLAGALAYGPDPDPVMKGTQQAAALAALAGVRPTDPLEGMLAAQMVAVHDAAMMCLRRANVVGQSFEARKMNLDMANRLSRTYATLLEALDKRRGKGQPQVVRVERVTVEAGGRAIVGPVSHRGGGGRGDGAESEERSHAPSLAHEPGAAVWGADPGREPVPLAGGAGQAAVPDARGARRRA